jgi:hypothetical protein
MYLKLFIHRNFLESPKIPSDTPETGRPALIKG